MVVAAAVVMEAGAAGAVEVRKETLFHLAKEE